MGDYLSIVEFLTEHSDGWGRTFSVNFSDKIESPCTDKGSFYAKYVVKIR